MTERQGAWEPLRKALPHVHWQRLENLVGSGVPDVNGCLNGIEAWVETKLIKGNQITFQPFQPAWLLKRLHHGGRVFVLARKDDTLMLWGGSALAELLRSVKERGKVLVADYNDSIPLVLTHQPFNWRVIANVLFKEDR